MRCPPRSWLLAGLASLSPLTSDVLAWTAVARQQTTDARPEGVTATGLRCDRRVEPLGVGTPHPRLAWRTDDAATTTAWQVRLVTDRTALQTEGASLWDSGRREGIATHTVLPPSVKLPPATRLWWSVRLWDAGEQPGEWSEPSSFTTAPDPERDWPEARWIGAATEKATDNATDQPEASERPAQPTAPWLRHRFDLADRPRDAVLHVASLGYHDVFANGQEASFRGHDVILAPHVSDLSSRVRVTSYDVTELLAAGPNTLGLWLGAGWARYPRYGVEGTAPLVRAILDVTLADGSRRRITTGLEWQLRPSNRELIGKWNFGSYGGERVDAGASRTSWATNDDSADDWQPVAVHECALELVPQQAAPNRAVREISVAGIERIDETTQRIDFERSFTGQTTLRLRGEPGATIRLGWSERDKQRATYGQRSELVLDESGRGTFAHRFNYASAKTVWVEGPVEAIAAKDVSGHLVRTAYDDAAWFDTDDARLTALRDAARHTFESLSLGGYIVDCAHRERWGYGGDAHATMELALNEFDVGAFYAKWLDDWTAIQNEFGNLPFTAPTFRGGGGPAWSGIVVMLPWEIYRRTGDAQLLERSWPTIERWLEFLDSKTEAGILQFYFDERYTRDVYSFLGDWVPPGGAQVGGIPGPKRRFFNNAYHVFMLRTAARVASALGRTAASDRIAAHAGRCADAVHATFYDSENDRYVEDRQTYWLLPLLAGLGDDALRGRLRDRLLADLNDKGHVDTGIHGTWFLVRWLLAEGRDGTAILHRLMTYPDQPGWQHMLAQGPGTLWEQWDGGNSRMHSSFLSIGAAFLEGFVGIRPQDSAPGYARCVVEPWLPPGTTQLGGGLHTAHGEIRCRMLRSGDRRHLELVVPKGVQVELRLPWEDQRRTLGPGTHEFVEGQEDAVPGSFEGWK